MALQPRAVTLGGGPPALIGSGPVRFVGPAETVLVGVGPCGELVRRETAGAAFDQLLAIAYAVQSVPLGRLPSTVASQALLIATMTMWSVGPGVARG